ncbi:MAG: hypothetical protein J6B85_04720 [Lachnospiraceae bacterium]|nr:hypothetical protein [Lachnospiraceae bacterium]
MKPIENPKYLHKNRLKPRSTVLPEGKITYLDGEFAFRYDGGDWGTLPVPSMWQFHGYGTPRYTNVDYPFPFNPPYVGNYNPVGEYKKSFRLEKLTARTILHFDGVDNAFYVYINGVEAGFSKGSRLAHEFDITALVKEGENELYVKVYTYSDASYLEAQDMILASGIFRSVYLIQTDEVSIWDYTIRTTMKDISVSVDVTLPENWSVRISVDGQSAVGTEQTFTIANPRLWNAEEPNLYEVVIALYYRDELRERHTKKVGLREVAIIDGALCVNRTPIKLKGVNRHEYVPDNGRAINYETTKKELLFLKENHVNAIRCSHYPNAPFFYELCNELGFYVMDESDLETHGCGVTGDQGYLSKSPEWLSAYLDRAERMYERDKNETCIIIWSVGNECGNGDNLVKCAEYLRCQEVKKPVHYPQDDAHRPNFIDFRQCSYMPVWAYEQMEYETDKWCDKPVIATEYAHAMGNSPGALLEYWKLMYHYKTFAGGFIWEFKNHGILRDGTYLYGGDFGEYNHAYNFCLDGFVMSDGTPKPAFQELAYIFAPIWVEYENGVRITNTNNFTPVSGLTWDLLEDYTVIKSGVSDLVIPPGESRTLRMLPDEMEGVLLKYGANYRVNIHYKGVTKQVALPVGIPKKAFEKEAFSYDVREEENRVTITGESFEIAWEKGMLSRYVVDGTSLIEAPVRVNFYRKPTDNDGIRGKHDKLTQTWDKAHLRHFEFFCEDSRVEPHEDEVICRFQGKILPEGVFAGFITELTYHVYQGGRILVDLKCEPYGTMPERLPRAGFVFELPKGFDEVCWYGRGPHENYADRKESALFGLYQKKAADMSFEYERPQENGNRCDTSFMTIGDLAVIGSGQFEFSVHDYSFESLMKAEHKGELCRSEHNYLYLDYRQRGLGSASCGPQPEEQYEFKPHSFRFAFLLKKNDGKYENEAFDAVTERLSDGYTPWTMEKVAENFDCRE